MDIFGKKRIAQLEDSLATQQRLFDIQQTGWRNMEQCWSDIAKKISINNLALARVIAKVDPSFAQDELDPERKAASDALGEEVIRKLMSEDTFSNRTRGF